MTISLTSVAAATTPTVIKTFFQHYKTQLSKDKEDRWTEATDEFMFHEAFAIVKRFIGIATTDTVEALQRFTNTQVPAQPGATVLRTLVPLSSCDEAAKLLIEYFGDEDLRDLVGGRNWWQVRGLKGVQAEWIAMRQDWNRAEKVKEAREQGMSDKEMKSKARDVGRNERHERKHASRPQRIVRRGSDKVRTAASKAMHRPSDAHARRSEASERERTSAAETDDDLDETQAEPQESIEELDRLERICYYICGGGYYFGSPNTHRQMLVRFARKFGGRVFTANYRKAPQFPWPCPVQDVLAGYLYLTNPPPDARHKPIDPKNIVVAGDSAGGGLCLALLGILRDIGKPLPAGGVLLSPWCDMTHSFPSILQNTATDIIPKYGFIHKPSTLWPVPEAASTSPSIGERNEASAHATETTGDHNGQSKDPKRPQVQNVEEHDRPGTSKSSGTLQPLLHLKAEPINVNVKHEDGKDETIQLRRQIQLYATNSQLYHPMCSPVLQGSLGGLPPLYILAGDSEVLRDEIIYLAHRAAHPKIYPLRDDLLRANARARSAAEQFNHIPTKVHLQVYDGQPHVLTLFSFTTSARYAYRAVASFVKHVTGAPTELVNPFPDLQNANTTRSGMSEVPSAENFHETMKMTNGSVPGAGSVHGSSVTDEPQELENDGGLNKSADGGLTENGSAIEGSSGANGSSDSNAHTPHSKATAKVLSKIETASAPSKQGSSDSAPKSAQAVDSPVGPAIARERKRRNVTLGAENDYDGQVPLRRPVFVQEMIRERVDIRGRIRPLEDKEQLQALQMPVEEVGVIKSGPVQRYLTGQALWDEKFKRTAKKVARQRARNEERIAAMLEQAAAAGLLDERFDSTDGAENMGQFDGSDWSDLSRFGPLALHNEQPPPSAIAGRRDTEEAVELYRQALHMRARRNQANAATATKVTLGKETSSKFSESRTKRRDMMGGVPWKQSAAERQIQGGRARYGLKAWANALSFFNRRKTDELRRQSARANSATAAEHTGFHHRATSSAVDDGDDESWIDMPQNNNDSSNNHNNSTASHGQSTDAAEQAN